jgi:hypothetical protein
MKTLWNRWTVEVKADSVEEDRDHDVERRIEEKIDNL